MLENQITMSFCSIFVSSDIFIPRTKLFLSFFLSFSLTFSFFIFSQVKKCDRKLSFRFVMIDFDTIVSSSSHFLSFLTFSFIFLILFLSLCCSSLSLCLLFRLLSFLFFVYFNMRIEIPGYSFCLHLPLSLFVFYLFTQIKRKIGANETLYIFYFFLSLLFFFIPSRERILKCLVCDASSSNRIGRDIVVAWWMFHLL